MSNPTDTILLDMGIYIARREQELSLHMNQGIPDYAFALDLKLRRRLDMIKPLRYLVEALQSHFNHQGRAIYEANGIAVGPSQFPHLHQMGVRCAQILGIGIPQIFIVPNPAPNAWTMATGDVDQLIILTTGLLDACDEQELLTVIGHECGHIHNKHSVYNTLWQLLTNTAAQFLLINLLKRFGPFVKLLETLISGATMLFMGRWSRCAEITCDRAGLICSGDLRASQHIHGKLRMGAVGKTLEGFNPEAYSQQLKTFQKSLFVLQELSQTHPLGPKRVRAIERFALCDTLHRWRPELVTQEVIRQDDLDQELSSLFL